MADSSTSTHLGRAQVPVSISSSMGVSLLIEAGAVLATSLEPHTTMGQVAQLTVPELADLCVIDLRERDGAIRGSAVAATDPRLALQLEALRSSHPIPAESSHPVARVLRSGETELLRDLTAPHLRSFATGEEHAEFMVSSEYRSAIVVPLSARRRTLGAISLLRMASAEPYTDAEVELACELARRAALAIDNAQLYSDLRSLEQRLEAILLSLAEAVTVVDREGRTVFANSAALRLLGASSAEEIATAAPAAMMGRFIVLDEDGDELPLEQMPARRLLRGEPAEPLAVRNIVRETGEERWLMVRASPILDPESGETLYAVNIFENITELKRAEAAERFLANASRKLSSSLDHATTPELIADLAVPELADLCGVCLLDEANEIVAMAINHADPEKRKVAQEMQRRYPARWDDPGGIAQVLRSGTAIHAQVGSSALARHAQDAHHGAMLAELGITSVIIVPISAGGRTLGAISLASGRRGRLLTPVDLNLAEELGRRAGVSLENSRLFTERSRIASVLQRALLPEALPAIPDVELDALYSAAGELNEAGGDFYDVFEHYDGRWVLAIGDVCGKGPRAAAVTALARHTLRAAGASGQAPRVMVQSVHQALMSQTAGGDMCTLAIVLADLRPPGAHLTIALAGHPHPLLLARDGTVSQIGRPGTLLGIVDPVRIEQEEVQMGAGDTLLLYTDGVSEAGSPRQPLGEVGLCRLCAAASQLSLPRLLSRIERAAIERAGGTARDDIALLAFRTLGDRDLDAQALAPREASMRQAGGPPPADRYETLV